MKGAAFPTVLVVSTVMMLILYALLSMTDNFNALLYGSLRRQQNLYTIESTVVRLCHDSLFTASGERYPFGDDTLNRVEWHIAPLGLFDCVTLQCGRESRTVILGAASNCYDSVAVWIADCNRPLSLTGYSNVKGHIYTSSMGLTYNQIRSEYFSGSKIDDRMMKKSGKELPPLDETIEKRIDSIVSSYKPTDEWITLSSSLFDTVIVAQSVKIDDSFTGSVQIFATDSVIVGANVRLTAPSGILIKGNHPACFLKIDKGSEINGYVIILPSRKKPDNRCANYFQDPTSVVRGLVYIDATAQMHGIVSGEAFVREASLFTSQGIFSNTLYHVTFIENQNQVYPFLLKERPYERRVLKWLK